LIPAFFAAYTKTPIGEVPLDFFKQMPKPNWRLNYDGLAKLEAVKKYYKTLVVSHAYRSTFSIASYTTNQFFVSDGNGNSTKRDLKENYLPRLILLSKLMIK
jgi:cell surface protein SprA